MKKKITLVLKFAIFLGLGIAILWWFQRKLTPDDKKHLLDSFRSANYLWVLISIIPGIVSHLSRSIRWKMLLKPMDYHPKLRTTFAAVMVGYFANLAFPRLGEVMRCGILYKYEKIPVSKSIGTVITERTVDMLVFLLLFLVTFAMEFAKLKDHVYNKFHDKFNNINITGVLFFSVIFIIALLVTLFFIFKKRLLASAVVTRIIVFIMGIVEGLKSLSKVEKPWLFVFHSLFIWLNYFLMVYFIFFCFSETNHLTPDIALAVLVMGSIGIMIVQGGIGIYPVIVSKTMLIFGVSETIGYAMGWIAWTSQTLIIILLGLLSLVILPILNKKKDAKA